MNDKTVYVKLVKFQSGKGIQLAVMQCPYCNNRHNHGIGEGWRVSECFDKKTGDKLPSKNYYLKIDFNDIENARLKKLYEELHVNMNR